MVASRRSALVAGRKVVLIALGLLRGRLGILPVEPAKRLAGADLAAGKRHGFKGSLVAKFRLHVRLLGRRRAGARIFRFVARVLFGHKAQPTRRSPQSRYFCTQSTTNLARLLLAFVMTAKASIPPSTARDRRNQRCLSLVNEVNADAIHSAAVVTKLRESFCLRLPVERVFPVAAQVLHEVEIDAVLPAGT